MSYSAIDTDIYSSQSASRPQPPAGGPGKPGGGEKMESLLSAIESGDTEAVEELLAEMPMPEGGHGSDPMGTFLSEVTAAVESGDVEAMQSAADILAAAPAPGDRSGGMQAPEGALAAGGGADFSSLLDALSSGDVEAAESAFATLTESLAANETGEEEGDNPLKLALAEVGELIEAGDTEAAASLMSDITGQMPHGGLVHMTA